MSDFWQAAKVLLGCCCCCMFVFPVMGCSEPHGSAILGAAPKGLPVLWGPPLCRCHCYLSTGPLDTVADPGIQGRKQQWHWDTSGATGTAATGKVAAAETDSHTNTKIIAVLQYQWRPYKQISVSANKDELCHRYRGWVSLVKMSLYSARDMQNDMQFGRVVIWNGRNELLSVRVDL